MIATICAPVSEFEGSIPFGVDSNQELEGIPARVKSRFISATQHMRNSPSRSSCPKVAAASRASSQPGSPPISLLFCETTGARRTTLVGCLVIMRRGG